jgi:hypothetical protein
MTDGFVGVGRPVAQLKGAWRLAHGATLPPPGTSLVLAEALELEAEDFLEGALDDGLAHVDGQGLEGVEVEVEPRSFLPVSAPGDDFPPPSGHGAELGQIVGLTPGEWHGVFVLELEERGKLVVSYANWSGLFSRIFVPRRETATEPQINQKARVNGLETVDNGRRDFGNEQTFQFAWETTAIRD